MKNNFSTSFSNNLPKIITGAILFCYFGWIIFPEWVFSLLFLLWLVTLPIVLITLIITGIRGGIGLWNEKNKDTQPNHQNKYYIWLASLSIVWFVVSIGFTRITYPAYLHKKFNSETWKTATTQTGLFDISLRQRMLDDLTKSSLLLGHTETDLINLLGTPDEGRHIEGNHSFSYYTGWGAFDRQCLTVTFDSKAYSQNYLIHDCY